jgi:hypothetical protein
VSTDVNALQLLPEIQNTTRLAPEGGNDEMFVPVAALPWSNPTCVDPTCIITYCSNPMTVIG